MHVSIVELLGMLTQFSHSSAELKRVRKIQFGVLSPEEIKRISVVEITKPGTYNAGLPIRGGLSDPALGAADPRSTCATCKNVYSGSNKINDCPGHFGRLELAAPVYHVGFMTEVYKLLQCVCHNCSQILADRVRAGLAVVAPPLSLRTQSFRTPRLVCVALWILTCCRQSRSSPRWLR